MSIQPACSVKLFPSFYTENNILPTRLKKEIWHLEGPTRDPTYVWDIQVILRCLDMSVRLADWSPL